MATARRRRGARAPPAATQPGDLRAAGVRPDLNPKAAADKAAYAIHLSWVAGAYNEATVDPNSDPCSQYIGVAKDMCENGTGSGADKSVCDYLIGSAKDTCEKTSNTAGYDSFIKDLSNAGNVGKAASEYPRPRRGTGSPECCCC